MNLSLLGGPIFAGSDMSWVGGLLLPLVLWSAVWKGFALWHSARRSETWWFIALLVVNTAGILEILYLFFVAKAFTRSAPTGPQKPKVKPKKRR